MLLMLLCKKTMQVRAHGSFFSHFTSMECDMTRSEREKQQKKSKKAIETPRVDFEHYLNLRWVVKFLIPTSDRFISSYVYESFCKFFTISFKQTMIYLLQWFFCVMQKKKFRKLFSLSVLVKIRLVLKGSWLISELLAENIQALFSWEY
jgi:hypothetical protein